ncbi:MAG: amino acid ABC transporter substrate-binding protein [Sneathiella sp.]|jgi:branched-chain amino acid transport system substrate-binding protein|nr:amino acid ABC transporter substrate-binding protein [Sneathiella sp.]|tara:strand:- start:7223 stop:8410 length:1188 start_codon:yes stop_codon:yes gene_type:complete
MKKIIGITGGALLALFSAQTALADETLKVGLSAPMSGAAAAWGLGFEYAAKQAVEKVNSEGGIKAGGKTYMLELHAYDNKYNAAEGAKTAQTMLNRENIKFIVGSIGTAPVRATQALSERQGVLLFNTGWGKSIKGPDYPLTFTQMNTPFEILGPFFGYIKGQHPDLKTVAMITPNDATGQEVEPVAIETWNSLDVEVVSTDRYERGTTEFQSIATKIANSNPDAVDFGASPPADVGSIMKALDVLGWDGIKVVAPGTSAGTLSQMAGQAAEGTYLGASADFQGDSASEAQRTLNEGAVKEVGESLNAITISSYDAVMALKKAIETADSIDPKKVAETLPTIIFESSYGPAAFGGKDVYGSPQQILIPVMITQVKDGKAVEVGRVAPEELKERLK